MSVSGTKPTSALTGLKSAFDPKRTLTSAAGGCQTLSSLPTVKPEHCPKRRSGPQVASLILSLSCRFPTDERDRLPKHQSSGGIEWRVLMIVLSDVGVSMACRNIRFQMIPNAARGRLTKSCPRFVGQAAASLGCAMAHWGRSSAEETCPAAFAKPY
jgi:hypothetical protein